MAVMDGVQETCYQQFFGTRSTGYFVDQITGARNEENNLNIEVPHSEAPNSSVLDLAGKTKNNEKHNVANTEHEEKAKCRTSEIADGELVTNSPSERGSHSPSHSRGRSRRRSRSPSGSSSSSSRSRSRSYYSRSRSSNRSASRSKHYKRYRRSSRSSSRSSRSLSPRYRRHSYSRRRRYHRSPRRYRSRSRSRSHVRVYYGRYRSKSRSRSRSRGRRFYGFVRRAYPATFRSWRSRSRTRSRSRSRSPLHLTEKDRLKLLEIAKANAAKALGKSVDLPPSLKKDSWLSDTLHSSFEADSGKLSKQPQSLNNRLPSEVSPLQGEHLFSSDSTVVQPVFHKQGNNLAWPQKKEEAKKAKGQWVPIQCQQLL